MVNGGVKRPGFGAGVKCLWGGIRWLVTTPDAWPSAVVPAVLGVVITAIASWTLIALTPGWVERLIQPGDSVFFGILTVIVTILGYALAIVVSGLIGFSLAQPLSGPALESLVRKRERDLSPPRAARAPTRFLSDIWRSLQSLLVGYAFGIPALALFLLLSLVVPAAAIVLFPMKLFIAAMTIAWDLCDYPLSLRGLPVTKRVAKVMRNLPAVLGFSLGMALVALVPCLLFLLLPAGVAGATELMAQIEDAERLDPQSATRA